MPEKPFATVFLGSGLFKYCFFLSEEMLYPGSRFRTADELLDLFIRQLLEAHETPEVTIAWQGGEPTLLGLKRAPTPS